MKISIYTMSVATFVPMLTSLAGIIDKAARFVEAKKIDQSVLVDARLAPDMFPFSLQIRIACFQAKLGTALLAGMKTPDFESPPATLAELKAHIEETVAYLNALSPSDFEGADEREIVFPIPVNNLELRAKGAAFLKDWMLPHFYFHVTTAYDILRHNGLELSKMDFMGHAAPLLHQRKG